MNVSMKWLAVGTLTALCFGGVMWCISLALAFICYLFFGKWAKGKWQREVSFALFILFFTISVILFLYQINGGVFRWFLLFAILAAFLMLSRFVSPRVHPVLYKIATTLSFPLRWLFQKCHLLISRLCVKLMVVVYAIWHKKTRGHRLLKEATALTKRKKTHE